MKKSIVSDDSGAMVIMSLFTTTFLVGLVWYLVGVGDALVYHEQMQDAADAIAFAPSVLHARGMNLIALVNLVMASTLAVLIALKCVQILLFAANVLSCLEFSWGDCAYLSAEESPFASFIQRVDNDVARLHRSLHSTASDIAKNTPLVGAERAVSAAQEFGSLVQDGFAASISLVPGSVEGGVGGQMTAPGGSATSTRLGLPVEDDDYANLCIHAGATGLGVYPILWEPVQRGEGGEQLEQTIMSYAGFLEALVAFAYPRMFCGGAGMPSDGPLGMIGSSSSDVSDNVCPKARRLRDVKSKCEDGMGAALGSFQSASALGSSRSTSLRIYAPARIGDDYFATWGVSTSDFIEKDDAKKGVAVALQRRRAPQGTELSQEELDRTLREAQIAKSEFYYDGARSWGDVRADGMWNLRWKARLRRQRQPNDDLARLLSGSGSSYIVDAAQGSQADVSRIVDTLVTVSADELGTWADKNIGTLTATRGTGGMVH